MPLEENNVSEQIDNKLYEDTLKIWPWELKDIKTYALCIFVLIEAVSQLADFRNAYSYFIFTFEEKYH